MFALGKKLLPGMWDAGLAGGRAGGWSGALPRVSAAVREGLAGSVPREWDEADLGAQQLGKGSAESRSERPK